MLNVHQMNNIMAVMHSCKAMEIAATISFEIIESGSLIQKLSVVLPEGIPDKKAGISIELEYTELGLGMQSELYKKIMSNISATMECAERDGIIDHEFEASNLVKIGPDRAFITIGVECNGPA